MTNMDQEIQKLIEQTKSLDLVPPPEDPGANNMERAGELAAQALRESFAEAAKRTLAVGQLAMDEAVRIEKDCKEEADRLLAHGEERAKELIAHFQHNQTATTGLKKIKESMYNGRMDDEA